MGSGGGGLSCAPDASNPARAQAGARASPPTPPPFPLLSLVLATEASGQALCRYVRRVEHAVAAPPYVGIAGMAVEVRAGQSAVPRPVVLSVRGGVHADVAAARPDVALEDVLLRRIEDVTRRIQEDDRAV